MPLKDSTQARSRVERGIYKRRGRFEVLVSSEGRVTFKPARSLTEARAFRGEILAKRGRGERVMPSAHVTLAKAIDAYMETARLRPSTKKLYKHNLDRPELRHLQRRKVASITIDDLAKFVRQLEAQGLAGSTIRNALIAISAVFTLAVRRGWTPTNPVRGLTRSERPKAGKHARRVLTPDEIRAVLDAAGDKWRMLIALAVFGGLRQSELLGLTWADIDLDAARLTVRKQLERGTRARVETKTVEAVRPVPLPAFVVRMLREYKLAAVHSLDPHAVFASTSGGGLDHRNIGRVWHGIRAAAKLAEPMPRFHDLRHTAASLWISEGSDVVYVSRVLGHSSPSITLDVYADLFDRARHEEKATAALDRAFGGGQG